MTSDDRAQFIAEVISAIKANETCLTSEEQQWVKLAIQRDAQSFRLRQAIIEKSLAGLVWAALIGLGVLIVDFAKNHGFK
jgi:hypothetical protein